MNVNQMFPSRYLKGDQLAGPVTVTVESIRTEKVYKPGEGDTEVFVIYFQKATRGVILTKPLAFSIAQALSDQDTDNWPGKAVTLYPQPMRVAGRSVTAIRARAAERVPANGK